MTHNTAYTNLELAFHLVVFGYTLFFGPLAQTKLAALGLNERVLFFGRVDEVETARICEIVDVLLRFGVHLDEIVHFVS